MRSRNLVQSIMITILLGACSGIGDTITPTPSPSPKIETPTSVPSATQVVRVDSTPTATVLSDPTPTQESTLDFQTILQEHDISFFGGALRKTSLPDSWSGEEQVTLLAPTNSAFATLNYGTYLAFRTDTAALTDAMEHHVVVGRYSFVDLLEADVLQTLDGAELTVKVEGDQILIDGAAILEADILSSFGYIHVIDRVLLPEE